MGDHNGAIVAIDPHTGAVLALVSRPSFRPQRFLGARLARRVEQAHHRSSPSAAGQGNSGPAGAGIHVQDHHVAGRPGEQGCAEFEGESATGAPRSTVASLPAISATARSISARDPLCPATPTTTRWPNGWALRRLPIGLTRWALGQKTGIDLPGEVSGTMPSEEWKMKTFHEKWYAGEVISVGIGQGAVASQPRSSWSGRLRGSPPAASSSVPTWSNPIKLPAEYRQAMNDSYPGSGDVTIPINPAVWETITDGMAGARPTHGRYGIRGLIWKTSTLPARQARRRW